MLEEILTTNVLVGSLLAILALILVDLAVRVAVSVAKGAFDWERVLDFLQTNVVSYVISWGAIEALMYATRYVAFPDEVTAPFAGIAALIYALIVGRLIVVPAPVDSSHARQNHRRSTPSPSSSWPALLPHIRSSPASHDSSHRPCLSM